MPDEPKQLTKISEKDVEAVTERIKEWIPTLPEQEQLVMGWILTRAAAADDAAVEDYTGRTEGGVSVSTLLSEAAGLGEVSGYASIKTIGPGTIWTFRW